MRKVSPCCLITTILPQSIAKIQENILNKGEGVWDFMNTNCTLLLLVTTHNTTRIIDTTNNYEYERCNRSIQHEITLKNECQIRSSTKNNVGRIPYHTGLDIGYVPAGSHAFLRLSGQCGPQQFIFHWPEGGQCFFFFVFLVLRMPCRHYFTGNRQNSEGNVNSYLVFVIHRPNVQKFATSRVKS